MVEVVVPPKGSGEQTSLGFDWDVVSGKRRKEVKICNIQVVENVQLRMCTEESRTQELHVPDLGASVRSNYGKGRTLCASDMYNLRQMWYGLST